MSENLITSVTTVLMALVGVAIIAILVSRNAATAQVVTAGAGGFSQDLSSALSPIVGGNFLSGFTGGAA